MSSWSSVYVSVFPAYRFELNKLTFDLDIWHVGSLNLKVKVNVHGRRMKKWMKNVIYD